MKIILICATTLDGYIARHSNEITNWTKDLKLFKNQTMGYPVIMGSNTFKTLQNELTGRKVIEFHRYDDPNTIIKELKMRYKKIFIAGGGKTNERFIEYITDMYITRYVHICYILYKSFVRFTTTCYKYFFVPHFKFFDYCIWVIVPMKLYNFPTS